jgi:hypothetical protein
VAWLGCYVAQYRVRRGSVEGCGVTQFSMRCGSARVRHESTQGAEWLS